jgi:hypothetical protein
MGLHAGTEWGREAINLPQQKANFISAEAKAAVKRANMNRAKAEAEARREREAPLGGGGSTNDGLSAIANKLRAAARIISNEQKTAKSNEKKNNRRTRKN